MYQLMGVFHTRDCSKATRNEHHCLSHMINNPENNVLVNDSYATITVSGKEPYWCDNNGVFVLFQGRIINVDDNIKKLSSDKCSATVAFDLYTKYGEGFASKINGNFTIIIIDRNLNRRLLIQDVFPGIQTMYWTENDNDIYFSNLMKPIVACLPNVSKNINNASLINYLRYSYVSLPNTIYKQINQLDTGQLLSVDINGNKSLKCYDSWSFSSERISDEKEALETYEFLLQKSITQYQREHESVAFLLSGGLDSSVNVALGAANSDNPLLTVGVGGNKYNTDTIYAQIVSEKFRTKHHEYLFTGNEIEQLPKLVWLMENPYFEPGLLLSYVALNNVKKFAPSIIGGDAADQIFGSCAERALPRYMKDKKTFGLHAMYRNMLSLGCRLPLLENSVFIKSAENRLIGRYNINNWSGKYGFRDSDIKQILRNNISFQPLFADSSVPRDLSSLLDYGCTTLNRNYTVSGLLPKTGRISSWLGVDYYSPFLDKDVFKHILSLDHQLRYKLNEKEGVISKYLHKQLAVKHLPANVIHRPKQGGAINPCIHLEDSYRLSSIGRHLLSSEYLNDLFTSKGIQTVVSNPKANAVRIIQLLVLDLWHFLFIKQPPQHEPEFTLSEYLD